MKTRLIAVGKTTSPHFQAAIADYQQRICHYMSLDIVIIPELKNARHLSEEQQKTAEGQLILNQILPGDTVVLLDEHGLELRSVQLAHWLGVQQQTARRLTFVIGGPYGFSSAVYQRANQQLSLSKLTFSHQMVRLIFIEQIYRACTILRGEPYHHE